MNPMEIASLEKRIRARERQLKRYIPFVQKILKEQGEILQENDADRYHGVTRWLTGFANFSFRALYGQTSMGSNTIRIYYHPLGDKIQKDNVMQIVLEIHSRSGQFDIEDYEVVFFLDHPEWQEKLNFVVKNKKKIIRQAESIEVIVSTAELVKQLRKEREVSLIAESQKLGIIF